VSTCRPPSVEFRRHVIRNPKSTTECGYLTAYTEGPTVKQSDVDPRYPDYYLDVEARYPALYAIETRDWVMAASLQPIKGADWFSQGQTLLAHAVAAGHMHDVQGGKAAARAIEALAATRPKLQAGSPRAALPDEIRA
jgi:hypothetical protein